MTILLGMLIDDSVLRSSITDGVGALTKDHRKLLDSDVRTDFTDSINLDAVFAALHPEDPRWDYLLGHGPSRSTLGIETHSARDGEVSRVIEKRKHALRQLRPHLRKGARVAIWYWVASGRVDFLEHERTTLRLADNGIKFVGRQLRASDLPAAPATASTGRGHRARRKP